MGVRLGGGPLVVGHRANSGRILLWYRRVGVRYVEVDVNVEGGRLVVKHGPPSTRRATPIGRLVGWLDYKLFYRDPLLGTRPLSEWLSRVQEELGVEGVLLDLKARVDAGELAGELEESGFRGLVMVSANDHRLLPRVKEAIPHAVAFASFNVRPVDLVGCAAPSRADGVGLRVDLLDPETVGELRAAGYLVSTWVVNDAETAAWAAGAGVDVIVTDRPDIVVEALRGARGRPPSPRGTRGPRPPRVGRGR